MSLVAVKQITTDLPWNLADQIVGYAQSVQSALDKIFTEANIPYSQEIADKVVFAAGLKKLYSIVNAAFWTLENSAETLAGLNVNNIRIGSADFSRGGDLYAELARLQFSIKGLYAEKDILQYISIPYPELVKKFSNERR